MLSQNEGSLRAPVFQEEEADTHSYLPPNKPATKPGTLSDRISTLADDSSILSIALVCVFVAVDVNTLSSNALDVVLYSHNKVLRMLKYLFQEMKKKVCGHSTFGPKRPAYGGGWHVGW